MLRFFNKIIYEQLSLNNVIMSFNLDNVSPKSPKVKSMSTTKLSYLNNVGLKSPLVKNISVLNVFPHFRPESSKVQTISVLSCKFYLAMLYS